MLEDSTIDTTPEEIDLQVEDVIVEGGNESETQDEPDEVVITLGDEPAPVEPEAAPSWVKDLRKTNREQAKQIKALQAEKQAQSVTQQPVKLPAKPTLADSDWDVDVYETELTKWHEQKRSVEATEAAKQAEVKNSQQAWSTKIETYNTAKANLKVQDFDEVEEVVAQHLSIEQQQILLQGSDNPEHIVYALGKSESKLKELAKIVDPVKFAFALAKLEASMKVTKKSAPAPESKVGGTAPISGTVDSALNKLRADAEKTGDYSKVMKYKAQHRKS